MRKRGTEAKEKQQRGGQIKPAEDKVYRKDYRLRPDQIERLASEDNASRLLRSLIDAHYKIKR